ncbi:hypothetical protein [Mongoliitalea daihaiensis]|uniref:hypothetical protein n=1 Tax=Mongoliitalea daihaiensis TaxID=2782006 RepID=UPI001F267D51|nr:hypothetical protein [Mongoliitalea daihaiensis]UJP65636.1 hypothetical protein IPZ59_03120 [Mongoliitalea daihaiensis]
MINKILSKLETTSKLKYELYSSTRNLFLDLERVAQEISEELRANAPDLGELRIGVKRINDHEFLFQIGGDTLVFILQSNISRLSDDSYLSKSKYLRSDEELKYFGQILIYNFLSDTIVYNRLDDAGYLIGRLLLNKEQKFFFEGERKIVFNFPELKDNPVTEEKKRSLIEQLLMSALENDLLTPAFQDIMMISYHQKVEHTSSMGSPKKIGFDLFAKARE